MISFLSDFKVLALHYQGVVFSKPVLGESKSPLQHICIRLAQKLMFATSFLSVLCGSLLHLRSV